MSVKHSCIFSYHNACKWIFILSLIFIHLNCSLYIRKRLGIQNARYRTQSEIDQFARLHIHYPGTLLQQNNDYYRFFNSKDSVMKLKDSAASDSFKVFIQPLQALYFDSMDVLRSVLVNCYAEPVGFNLNWNSSGRLDHFPPHSHTGLFGRIKLRDILKLSSLNIDSTNINSYKFKVVIFWNIFLNKQTKIFLKEIQSNLYKAKVPIEVFYINNDNSFCSN